jgi:integrase
MKKIYKLPLSRVRFPKIRDLGALIKKRYLVDARPHTRKRFETLAQAKTFADQLAVERSNQGVESLSFSTADRIAAAHCIARLRKWSKTITEATDYFVDHLEHERERQDSLLVSVCIDQFVDRLACDVAKKVLARNSFREARFRAREFSSVFGALHIAELNEQQFRCYLDQRSGSPQTKRNIWGAFSKFCSFCVRRGYIDRNPVAGLKIKVPRKDVTIFSIDEVRTLLNAAGASKHAADVNYNRATAVVEAELVPYFTIALFAGLRPTEILRLNWEQVSLATKTITVLAHTTKVRETRYVPINETLSQWLPVDLVEASGPIVGANFTNKFRSVLRAAGYGGTRVGPSVEPTRRWTPDICRHSFGSYWLALHKNRAELAEIMGNSVQVIRRHYRAPVLEADAVAYFALLPGS